MSQKGQKSPKKAVQTVTSNEELVRLWIFDGELPDTEGYKRLWELEKSQHDLARRRYAALVFRQGKYLADLQARTLWERLADWWRGLP